jgi:hypothetical protein
MAFKVRGGVMNITGSAHTIAAIEIDMRELKNLNDQMKAKGPVMTFLALFFGYQVDRFRR